MARKPLERSFYFPYHVYNRTIDKCFYPINKLDVWIKCCDLLFYATCLYGVRIHAFVLMGNHYHLIISTPDENLDQALRYFQSELSSWVTRKTQLGKYCFHGRYKWSIIKDPFHYANVYRYVYQNPLRAKLAKRAEEYTFSTIKGKHGLARLRVPLSEHEFCGSFPFELNEELDWINGLFDGEDLEKVRLGLRRKCFLPPSRVRRSGKSATAVGKSGRAPFAC